MPKLKEHLKISNELLGTKMPLVHRLLDYQGFFLEHRYRHSPKTVHAIRELLGPEGAREAWLHIFTDWGIIKMEKTSK